MKNKLSLKTLLSTVLSLSLLLSLAPSMPVYATDETGGDTEETLDYSSFVGYELNDNDSTKAIVKFFVKDTETLAISNVEVDSENVSVNIGLTSYDDTNVINNVFAFDITKNDTYTFELTLNDINNGEEVTVNKTVVIDSIQEITDSEPTSTPEVNTVDA